jgi:hypothetical protein
MSLFQKRFLSWFAAAILCVGGPVHPILAHEMEGPNCHCPEGATSCETTAAICSASQCAATVSTVTSGASGNSLDLGSTQRTITPAHHEGFTQANLQVGDSTRTITGSSLLTPAEHVALHQVLSTGKQALKIGALGDATGGHFDISSELSQAVHNLVIPRGVSGIVDAARGAANVTGDLANAGALYAFSSNAQTTAATISANNIINQPGGIISSALPSAFALGIASAVGSLDLNLSATNNIINQGLIQSSGNLSLTAGGSIVNALPAGVSGAVPVMSATNNVNFTASNIVNSGLISAIAGNINVTWQSIADVLVQNSGGAFQALAGAINFRDPLFADKASLTLLGGDWLSRELNAFGGRGTVRLDVGDVGGLINLYAHEAHITVSGDNLRLGTIQLIGDPTFFNTGGDVTINASIIVTDPIAIIASGNIFIDPAVTIQTDGDDIVLVAGANITSPPPVNVQVNNDTTTLIEIANGGSSTGGNITAGVGSAIRSSSAGDAGDITLVAFAGPGGVLGEIDLANGSTIEAKGGGGLNGNVLLLANGTAAGGITVGSIDASGGQAGGQIFIGTTTAFINSSAGCSGCVRILDGAIQGGGAFVASKDPILVPTDVHVQGPLNADQTIDILAGDDIQLDAAVTANGINLEAGGNVTAVKELATDHQAGAFINISSGGDVSAFTLDATGDTNVDGGAISVFAENLFVSNTLASGASIDASAGSGFTTMGGIVAITTLSANPFVVGGAAAPNGTDGDILAEGANGGQIFLSHDGGLTVNGTVSANGKGGTGGLVYIDGASPMVVTLNGTGTISATNSNNDSGTVAISAIPKFGGQPQIAVQGTGTIQAGQTVKVGNINPITLKFQSPKPSAVNIANTLTIGNQLQNQLAGPPVLLASAGAVLPAVSPPTQVIPVSAQAPLAQGEAIQKIPTDQTPVNQGSVPTTEEALKNAGVTPLGQVILASDIETDMFDARFVADNRTGSLEIAADASRDNFIVLERGNVVFRPRNRDIVVKVQEGLIFIGEGCDVLVIETGNDVAVYNLHDTYKGAVRVVAGRREVVLSPGMQLVLTRNKDARFEDVNPGTQIAYRNARSEDMGEGIKAFAADFSIPSAMTRVQPLRRILASKKSKDRQVAYQMLKNAVVLATLSGNQGPYKSK